MRSVAVIGLGYVGLPVAVAFARAGFETVGFDIDKARIHELLRFDDRTKEVSLEALKASKAMFTFDNEVLKRADFFIVTVPTPITQDNIPDLSALIKASETVGRVLKKGDIVVYESTVYPGCTQEDCLPVLERVSGLKLGDFTLGYSPERINPGDKINRFETILKITSGSDPQTADIVAETYGQVVTAGIYKASSIKVAEAAKVIENTQRHINIAFMNELSAIFGKLGIDTLDVLEAAGTKWNFLPFKPGLVGGHCIGVDPFYLMHKAARHGYFPEMIEAGGRVNNEMGRNIARDCVRLLMKEKIQATRITVLGLTFKENVPDIRNSKVVDIIDELHSFGLEVQVIDPHASPLDVSHEYNITLTPLYEAKPAEVVIAAVQHASFKDAGWTLIEKLLPNGGLVMDIKGYLPRETPKGITLWRL
jgi:UDP-N-acetyl-D-glucosamine/UDP-N-acetyl-D-galactosamine dehydrogenase